MRNTGALPEVLLSPLPYCPHLKATLCAYGAGGAEFWSAWRLAGHGSRSKGDSDTVDVLDRQSVILLNPLPIPKAR